MKAHDTSDINTNFNITSLLQSILLINTKNTFTEEFNKIQNDKLLSPMERQLEHSKLLSKASAGYLK